MITVKRLNDAIDKMEFDATLVLSPEEIILVLKMARQTMLNVQIESRDKALAAHAALERAGVFTPRERHEADMSVVRDNVPVTKRVTLPRTTEYRGSEGEVHKLYHADELVDALKSQGLDVQQQNDRLVIVTDHWTQQNMQAALYPIGALCPEILAERLTSLKWAECDGKDGRPDSPGNWVRVA